MKLKQFNLGMLKRDKNRETAEGKEGKHKNALTYTDHTQPPYNNPYNSSLLNPSDQRRAGAGWLQDERTRQELTLVANGPRPLNYYQYVFDKHDETISGLLMDMAVAAKWNRWHNALPKLPRILKKQGDGINGWGWVVYRIHSSGEAILPEQPEPHNYTLFNFWQISFSNGHKPDLSSDSELWHLHACDTLEDFERLSASQVERWLKEQLYHMFSNGCMWVAMPEMINEKGKPRKPGIQDALYTYNVLSYGRNYDSYQTEAHFYDRPPYQNQFVPGYFKR